MASAEISARPVLQTVKKHRFNRRKKAVFILIGAAILIAVIFGLGTALTDKALSSDFTAQNIAPCPDHPFGTDWLGRDMFARTFKGLSISILIGLVASLLSTAIALVLGFLTASLGKWADAVVNFLVNTMMGLPHILLLVLICVAMGKGPVAIMVAVALTHWPSMTRLVRGEVLQLKSENYVHISRKLGQNPIKVAVKHMLPHILPLVLVSFVLMFPHAILHEASVTFLGFGLTPEQPGIGVVLSESMKYITMGMWWLAVLPGASLLLTVVLFDRMGDYLKKFLDPRNAQG